MTRTTELGQSRSVYMHWSLISFSVHALITLVHCWSEEISRKQRHWRRQVVWRITFDFCLRLTKRIENVIELSVSWKLHTAPFCLTSTEICHVYGETVRVALNAAHSAVRVWTRRSDSSSWLIDLLNVHWRLNFINNHLAELPLMVNINHVD